MLPHLLHGVGIALPGQSEQVLATLGLVLGMGVFGVDILRQAECAVPRGLGGRIAGFADLAAFASVRKRSAKRLWTRRRSASARGPAAYSSTR